MEPRLQKLCSDATKVTPAEGFWRHSVPRVQIACELGPSKKKLKIHPLATLLQSIMLVSWQWMCEAPRFVVCCVCIRLLVSNVHEQHLKALGYYAPCLFLASWKLHDLFQFFNCSWQKNDEKFDVEVREIASPQKEPARLSYYYQASWL